MLGPNEQNQKVIFLNVKIQMRKQKSIDQVVEERNGLFKYPSGVNLQIVMRNIRF